MANVSEEDLLELQIKVKNGIKLSKEEKLILKENSKEEREKKKTMSFGQRLLKVSKTEYGQLMGENEEDKFPIRDWISTGNYLFNAQISADYTRGIPSGRVVMLAGAASTGKSFLALETAKNAQALGYFVVMYDSEMANNDKAALKSRGIDIEQMLYIPIDTVENLKTSLINIIDEASTNDKLFIIVDSIGNLSTNKELEDSTDGSTTKDMTRPAQLRALFRTVTLKAGIKHVPVIAINHTYAQIGGFLSGAPVIAGGGGGMYNSSIIVEFTKAQEKGSDGRMSGALISSTVTKCRTAKERTKVKFTIDFEEGLGKYSGLQLFCEDEKIFVKEGRSFKLNPDRVSDVVLSVGETFTSAKMNAAFWDELLEKYLGGYLAKKFKYQSVTDEVLGDDFDETEEDIDDCN